MTRTAILALAAVALACCGPGCVQEVPQPTVADTAPEPVDGATRPGPHVEPEAPGRSADEILREAQAAYAEGDRPRAISLALQATGRPGDAVAAWRFLGTAACQEKDGRLATRAYRHLGAADKQFVLGVCQRQGMDYLDGEFRPDPWP